MNRRTRIPKAYYKAKFSDLKGIDSLIAQAKEAIDNGQGITFIGKVGSGKTHLAICLMRYFWNKNKPPIREAPEFINIPDLILEIKDSWSKGDSSQARSEKDIIDYYVRPSLIVLDDLGVGKIGDWARGVFYMLIDRRIREEKPTILTSNLTPTRIANEIDDRIASRLYKMGPIMELGDKDWRKG
jgi:DNA replication protein DnaC